MKVYTKTGDSGTTGLFGGGRVSKASMRVDAYGDVDELNSFIGVAVASLKDEPLRAMLTDIQARLFEVGADLATPATPGQNERVSMVPRIDASHSNQLEKWIDSLDEQLEEMRHFILPGGSEAAAHLHVCRTVCRRAERRVVALAAEEQISPDVVIYLNRLSDLLFMMARRANQIEGVDDVPWHPPAQKAD